jgi:hypothetical protein
MKCEEKVDQYCRQVIKYKKYAEIRRCNKCCIDCLDPCSYLCDKALEFKNMTTEGGEL